MGTPKGAVSPRRLSVTPELLADVRRRYEQTDEPLATMAADLGCSLETVRNIGTRENWVRYVRPPHDLTPAARLKVRAEALAKEQGALTLPPRSGGEGRPPELAQQATADGVGGEARSQETPTPIPSPQGGGEDDAAPPQVAETAQQLHRELLALIAEVKATRQRMKREGYGKSDLQEASRMVISLSGALGKLKPMLPADPQAESDDAYDDTPADIDEFREALARKIEAFMESRPDEDGPEETDAAGDDVAGS